MMKPLLATSILSLGLFSPPLTQTPYSSDISLKECIMSAYIASSLTQQPIEPHSFAGTVAKTCAYIGTHDSDQAAKEIIEVEDTFLKNFPDKQNAILASRLLSSILTREYSKVNL